VAAQFVVSRIALSSTEGPDRGTLSLVRVNELLERKSGCSDLEN
jgi:hypothetical protein